MIDYEAMSAAHYRREIRGLDRQQMDELIEAALGDSPRIIITDVALDGGPKEVQSWTMEYWSKGPPPARLGEYAMVYMRP